MFTKKNLILFHVTVIDIYDITTIKFHIHDLME